MSEKEKTIDLAVQLSKQAWISLALWFSFGLLLEGLIGFRSPAYLQDSMRRDLFRLAHAHGAILGLVLLLAALSLKTRLIELPALIVRLLQAGALLMPLGFLLGGLWHSETDPNAFVFLAPIGGVLLIFGIVATAISAFKDQNDSN